MDQLTKINEAFIKPFMDKAYPADRRKWLGKISDATLDAGTKKDRKSLVRLVVTIKAFQDEAPTWFELYAPAADEALVLVKPRRKVKAAI